MIAAALRLIDRRPLWILAGLIVVAAAARFALALGSDTPWIFADEYIYAELARSLAVDGDLLLRGQRIYFSTLVPLMHAPGFLLGDTATAYVWIKGANAVAMSLAALPAYGLARIALGVRLSLAFAVLVLAWPAFAYTGTVMTEPLFFPLALGFAWALARALRTPTLTAQALVGLMLLAALLVRLQAVVLLASIPIACLLVALLGRGGGLRGVLARLRPLAPMLAVAVGLPLLAVLAQIARSQPVRSLLGGYGGLSFDIGLSGILDWNVWHVAVIALSVGVVPLILAVGTWTRAVTRRDGDPGAVAVVVTCFAIAVPMTVQVALFAGTYGDRVQERNLFTIEPLILLVALVGLASLGVSRVGTVVAAVLVVLALADLPVAGLIAPQPPLSDTFTLLALMEFASATGVSAPTLAVWAGIAGAVIAVAIVLWPSRRRVAPGLALAVLVLLLVMNAYVTPLLRDYSDATAGAWVADPADWVDRAAPEGAEVLLAWSSEDPPLVAWGTEFWNDSIGPVMAVPAPFPTLNGALATIDPATGRFVPPPGAEIPRAEYVVAPARWEIAGTEIAQGRSVGAPMTLWRIEEPLGLSQATEGLYPDGWTGPAMTVRRYGCSPGEFVLHLRPGTGRDRMVTVTADGVDRRVRLRGGRVREVRVPARPDAATGACVVTVTPDETATGAELGNPADPRELGVRAGVTTFVEDA